MEQLKPCPFCGSQASLMDIDDLYTAHGDGCVEYRVMCSRCECTTGGDDGYTAAKEALLAWNTRPIEAEMLDMIWRLRDEVASWHKACAVHSRGIVDRDIIPPIIAEVDQKYPRPK